MKRAEREDKLFLSNASGWWIVSKNVSLLVLLHDKRQYLEILSSKIEAL